MDSRNCSESAGPLTFSVDVGEGRVWEMSY